MRQCKGRRGVRWEDPTTWVVTHLPWSDHPGSSDCPSLLRLRAEDLGCEAPSNGGHQNITATDRQAESCDVYSASDNTDPLVSILYIMVIVTSSSAIAERAHCRIGQFWPKVLRLRRYERMSIENRRFCSNWVSLSQSFRYKLSFPTNRSSCRKTRINILSYGLVCCVCVTCIP